MSNNQTAKPSDLSFGQTKRLIYDAWAIHEYWRYLIQGIFVMMYLFTINFSILAWPLFFYCHFFLNLFFFSDMVFKIFGLGSHPADQAFAFKIEYFFEFSFRRWIIQILLEPFHYITQIIPLLNWSGNFIVIFLFWVNAFLF